jgi:hypothetical protein
LSHTRYDVVDAMIAGINGSDGDEEEVPARHECRVVGVAFLFSASMSRLGLVKLHEGLSCEMKLMSMHSQGTPASSHNCLAISTSTMCLCP